MRHRPSCLPLNLWLDSNPLRPPVCHVVISLLAHWRSCTRLNSDISDPTPTVAQEESGSGEDSGSKDEQVNSKPATGRGYPLGGFLMERPLLRT